ncbi:MAG: HAMP domain-containing protein [Rhodospirillales bacterium]
MSLKTKFLASAGIALFAAYLMGVVGGLYLNTVGSYLLSAVFVSAAGILLLLREWKRWITDPVEALVRHVQVIRGGTWPRPLPVAQSGEIGEITAAINELGHEWTSTAHRCAANSKLAAAALIENRVGRRLNLAAEHLASIVTLLALCRDYKQPIPEAAIRNLELAIKDLREIAPQMKKEFEREWESREVQHSVASG